MIEVNTWFNFLRRKLGFGYWSLSAYLKHRVKNAVQFIGKFKEAVVAEARRQGVDGVVCGHIHTAEMRMIAGELYINDGHRKIVVKGKSVSGRVDPGDRRIVTKKKDTRYIKSAVS